MPRHGIPLSPAKELMTAVKKIGIILPRFLWGFGVKRFG